MEGKEAALPKAGDIMRREVPTCTLADRPSDARARAKAARGNLCVVVNEAGVVLGRLSGDASTHGPDETIESVMESGPTTFRPDVELESLGERMKEKKVGSVIVTNSDGLFLGVLYREDAESRLKKS